MSSSYPTPPRRASKGLEVGQVLSPARQNRLEQQDYQNNHNTPYNALQQSAKLRRPKSVGDLSRQYQALGLTTRNLNDDYIQMDESHDFGDHEYFGNESGSYLPLIRQYSVNEHTSRFSPPTPPSDPMPRMSRLLGVGRQPSSLPQGSARQDVPLGTSPGGHWNLPRGPAFPGLNDSGQYQPLRETDSVRTCSSAVFPQRITGPRKRALSEGECQLNRQGTLITPHADSKRASAELGIMLGNNSRKANKAKLLPQGQLPIEEKLAKLDQVKLEAKKGRKARVEVDVVLESEVLVEGGELRGRLEVRIRKGKKGESLWIGGGKVRVCGYEGEA